MLALGASVVSVEPAADLARVANETVHLNCWANRSRVINAFADAAPYAGPQRAAHLGWRLGGRPPRLKHWLPRSPSIFIDDVLATDVPADPKHSLIAGPRHFDLIKLDGDGPEGSWMSRLDILLRNRTITVGAIILEASNLSPETMYAFQNDHGFAVYRLDMHDDRRFIDSHGWDAYSPAPGTIARLDRLRKLKRDQFEDELFGVRLMRHVFRAKDGLSVDAWRELLRPIARFPVQMLLMRDTAVVEHHAEHPLMTTAGDPGYAAMAIERADAMRQRKSHGPVRGR